jgi:hypothetical protein
MAANAPENVRRLLAWQKENPEPRPKTLKERYKTLPRVEVSQRSVEECLDLLWCAI